MTDQDTPKRPVARRFADDVSHRAGWQKILLLVFLLLAVAGLVIQGYLWFKPMPTPAKVSSDTEISTPPPGGRSFVGGSPKASDSTTSPTPTAEPQPAPGFLAQYSPGMTRMGLSFVGSFLIGWAFRVFVKTMVLATLVLGGGLLALSYFNVINVDFSAAREQYTSAAGWLFDQASRLKDAAMAYLPASSSGVAGLIIGMKKK